jgi:2'-5' RNA ligase
MRLFFALPLPEALQAALAIWQRRAREAGLVAAFPRPEGLHLTLVFLGRVEPLLLPALGEAASVVAAQRGPFPLQSAQLGAFPTRGAPRVIWLGLEPSTPLGALQQELALALEPLGFPREEHPFAPHLTLARPKGSRVPGELPQAPAPISWTAGELVLYESLAAPTGQRYEKRGSWPLSGSPPLR